MSLSINQRPQLGIAELERIIIEENFFLQFDIHKDAPGPHNYHTAPNTLVILKHKNLKTKDLFLTEIVEKVRSVTENIKIKKIQVVDYENSFEYYEMPAKNSKHLFKAISQLQSNGTIIPISKGHLKETLISLQGHHYIKSKEADAVEATINTSLSFQDYKNKTTQTSDFTSAIALAYYYRERHFEQTKYWLCEARKYLETTSKESLAKLINVDDFLLGEICSNSLSIIDLFEMNEIKDSLARYKKLRFHECCYSEYTYERVGQFLKKTLSIKTVNFGPRYGYSYPCHCPRDPDTHGYGKSPLDAKTITPIANALLTNSSVTKINLFQCLILDEGVLKIVNAIKNNPHSSITQMYFFDCGITDVSAQEIINLCREKDQIIQIDILSSQNKISSANMCSIKRNLRCNQMLLANRIREFILELRINNDLIDIIFEYSDFLVTCTKKEDFERELLSYETDETELMEEDSDNSLIS